MFLAPSTSEELSHTEKIKTDEGPKVYVDDFDGEGISRFALHARGCKD